MTLISRIIPFAVQDVADAQSACLDCENLHCTELQAAMCKVRLDHEAALKADAGKGRA